MVYSVWFMISVISKWNIIIKTRMPLPIDAKKVRQRKTKSSIPKRNIEFFIFSAIFILHSISNVIVFMCLCAMSTYMTNNKKWNWLYRYKCTYFERDKKAVLVRHKQIDKIERKNWKKTVSCANKTKQKKENVGKQRMITKK